MDWRSGSAFALVVGCGGPDDLGAPSATHTHHHLTSSVPTDVPPTTDDGYVWELPGGFPLPNVPDDNPMSGPKFELGRHLFYDRRLSGNGTQSCADCHHQDKAFTDGLTVPIGSTGEPGLRNAPSIANAAYAASLTWASPVLVTLEQQIPLPMFGELPVELGLSGHEDEVWQALAVDPVYQDLFQDAFPTDDGAADVSTETVVFALASFVRGVMSGDAPYDRYVAGDDTAMSASAVRGLSLFAGERLECTHCHGTFLFGSNVDFDGLAFPERVFHNDGLYDVDGDGGYPPTDPGLIHSTGLAQDMGRFKPPSLRNVAVSAPYFHDGSTATLDEVLTAYARGGRLVEDGPWAGDGAGNPYKSGLLAGFTLTDEERADLLAFFDALTDETLLSDPRLSDPWL